MNLTLNERSYLQDFILKLLPDMSEETKNELWDLTGKIDREERAYLLSLCFQKQPDVLAKVVADKIIKYI